MAQLWAAELHRLVIDVVSTWYLRLDDDALCNSTITEAKLQIDTVKAHDGAAQLAMAGERKLCEYNRLLHTPMRSQTFPDYSKIISGLKVEDSCGTLCSNLQS